MKKLSLLLLTALMATSFNSFAQDDADDDHVVTIGVSEVFIMDIEAATSKNFTLTLAQPNEAGNPVDSATNSDLWINYTSIVDVTNSETRTITAQTDATTPGYILKVEAGTGAGAGGGDEGDPVTGGPVTLTNASASTIIENIGSAYTGNGTSSGHNLEYILYPATGANFGNLDHSQTQNVTVTYTITD